MRGGARPHRIHCAQLGEWMPANHYASKWDATSKKKKCRQRAPSEPICSGNYCKYLLQQLCCKISNLLPELHIKGRKNGLWKTGIILLVFALIIACRSFLGIISSLGCSIRVYFSKILSLTVFVKWEYSRKIHFAASPVLHYLFEWLFCQ